MLLVPLLLTGAAAAESVPLNYLGVDDLEVTHAQVRDEVVAMARRVHVHAEKRFSHGLCERGQSRGEDRVALQPPRAELDLFRS